MLTLAEIAITHDGSRVLKRQPFDYRAAFPHCTRKFTLFLDSTGSAFVHWWIVGAGVKGMTRSKTVPYLVSYRIFEDPFENNNGHSRTAIRESRKLTSDDFDPYADYDEYDNE